MVNLELFEELIQEFRSWNMDWDYYTGTGDKPENQKDFLKRLSKKYVVLDATKEYSELPDNK